jgi:hypothetical protein
MKMGLGFLAAMTAVLWLATVANAAGPHSIFDDDWTPPKASEAPRPPAQPVPDKPAASGTESNSTASRVRYWRFRPNRNRRRSGR